jgi:nickel-dependent lactate racemase
MKVNVPQLLWYERSELEMDFPDTWDVQFCPPRGYDQPKLTPQKTQEAFDNPIEMAPIREIASGKKEAVIIFDDITRPTPIDELAPYVLRQLAEAGISDDQIRFVVASGSHGAHDNLALRKKVGQEIMQRFPVYNHNPYENCVFVGTTSHGTDLAVNREVMSCDLKIAVGTVFPHPQAGFGGGGKLILPGVSHIDSIDHFHRTILDSPPGTVGMGRWDENPMRFETEEAIKLAGVDVVVNGIMNGRCEVTQLLVGSPLPVYHEGVRRAKEVYATVPPAKADIVVTNSYAKPSEAVISLIIAFQSVKPEGGTIVLIMNSPEGQIIHYLMGRFGKQYGGRQYTPRVPMPPPFKLIIMNPQKDLTCTDLTIDGRSAIWAKDWGEVARHLKTLHPDGARVAVFPDGGVQYLAPSP